MTTGSGGYGLKRKDEWIQMEKKNVDWGNLGFDYMPTDERYVSHFIDEDAESQARGREDEAVFCAAEKRDQEDIRGI